MKPVAFDASWGNETRNVYHHDRLETGGPWPEPTIYWSYQDRLKFLSEVVARHAPEGGRILDVGCAQGTFALLMAENGYAVVANDIREQYLAYARQRYEKGDCAFVCANFVDLAYREEFDVIVFTEVIEHLIDHDTFVSALRKALKPRGILIVTTPNHAYFRNRLPTLGGVDLEKNRNREFSADGDDHFYAFTLQELETLLKRNGLHVVESGWFQTFLDLGHLKTRYLWRFLSHALLRRTALLFCSRKELCGTLFCIPRR